MRVTHKRSYTPRMKGTSEDEMVLEIVLEVKKENRRGGMICSSRKDIVLYIYWPPPRCYYLFCFHKC